MKAEKDGTSIKMQQNMDSDDGKVLDGFFLVNFCYHFNHNTNCIVNYDKNEVKCQLHIIVPS